MLRASLTEAAVGFTHIELVAKGAVDDIDKVGGEAGEGGADQKKLFERKFVLLFNIFLFFNGSAAILPSSESSYLTRSSSQYLHFYLLREPP
jgi:hypothetical protein